MFDLLDDFRYAFVDEQALILLALFASVIFFFLAGASALSSQPTLRTRLQPRAIPGKDRGATLRYGFSSEGSRNLLRRLERSFAPQDDQKRSHVRLRMLRAGFYHPQAATVYYAVRVVLAIGLPALALSVWPMLFGIAKISTLYLVGVGAMAAGFFGPALVVSQKIEGRQRVVREAFPDALDMMLVCVEAGLGLNAAMSRVAGELEHSHPLLSEHFQIVGLEMQAGVGRDRALRNLGARIGIDEVSALVTLLNQADSMGVSIAQTLRVYALEMRRKRLIRAEEHANKLPVHMVMPLAAFILPAFILVVTTPTVIRVIRILIPALGGGKGG